MLAVSMAMSSHLLPIDPSLVRLPEAGEWEENDGITIDIESETLLS